MVATVQDGFFVMILVDTLINRHSLSLKALIMIHGVTSELCVIVVIPCFIFT